MRGTPASVLLIAIILLIVIPPATEAGPETGTIHGILTDSATGEPIAGATALIAGTKRGATTNLDGAFKITDIDAGTYDIVLSHLVYETDTISGVVIETAANEELTFRLVQKVVEWDCSVVIRSDSGWYKEWHLRKDTLLPLATSDGLMPGSAKAGDVQATQGELSVDPERPISDQDIQKPRTSCWNDTRINKDPIQTQPVTALDALLEQLDGVNADVPKETITKNQPVSMEEELPRNADGLVANENGEVFTRDNKKDSASVPNEGEVDHVLGASVIAPPDSKASAISGTVVDAGTGKGINSVSVILVGTGHCAVTDSEGDFALYGVAVGEYEILFSGKGYKTAKLSSVAVRDKVTRTILQALEPIVKKADSKTADAHDGVGHIYGILTDSATGESVAGASVMVVGTKSGAMTDLDGMYIISKVKAGTYEIKISHRDYETVTVNDVVVEPGRFLKLSRELVWKPAIDGWMGVPGVP